MILFRNGKVKLQPTRTLTLTAGLAPRYPQVGRAIEPPGTVRHACILTPVRGTSCSRSPFTPGKTLPLGTTRLGVPRSTSPWRNTT